MCYFMLINFFRPIDYPEYHHHLLAYYINENLYWSKNNFLQPIKLIYRTKDLNFQTFEPRGNTKVKFSID